MSPHGRCIGRFGLRLSESHPAAPGRRIAAASAGCQLVRKSAQSLVHESGYYSRLGGRHGRLRARDADQDRYNGQKNQGYDHNQSNQAHGPPESGLGFRGRIIGPVGMHDCTISSAGDGARNHPAFLLNGTAPKVPQRAGQRERSEWDSKPWSRVGRPTQGRMASRRRPYPEWPSQGVRGWMQRSESLRTRTQDQRRVPRNLRCGLRSRPGILGSFRPH